MRQGSRDDARQLCLPRLGHRHEARVRAARAADDASRGRPRPQAGEDRRESALRQPRDLHVCARRRLRRLRDRRAALCLQAQPQQNPYHEHQGDDWPRDGRVFRGRRRRRRADHRPRAASGELPRGGPRPRPAAAEPGRRAQLQVRAPLCCRLRLTDCVRALRQDLVHYAPRAPAPSITPAFFFGYAKNRRWSCGSRASPSVQTEHLQTVTPVAAQRLAFPAERAGSSFLSDASTL
mmetsp:Transcript_59186/g.128444  ORF Transcript_59186/g.128444 Transcript_59186/m.128444 type:complete len:236 (-) Transcript_59186:580-1287(-)